LEGRVWEGKGRVGKEGNGGGDTKGNDALLIEK